MANPTLVGTGATGPVVGSAVAAEALPAVQNGDKAYWVVSGLIGATTTLTNLPAGVVVEVGPVANASNALQVWLLSKTLTSADSGMVLTGTLSASAQHYTAFAVVRSGAVTIAPYLLNGLNTATIPYPNFTPAVNDVLAVALTAIQFVNNAGSIATTPPTDWVEQEDVIQTAGTSRGGVHVASRQYVGGAGATQSGIVAGNTINHRSITWVLVAQPTDTAPPEPTPVNPTAIGQPGDSLSAQLSLGDGPALMETRYLDKGYTSADVNGIGGRFVYRGADASGGTPAVLAAWAGANFNPRTLVLALGTNNVLSATAASWAAEVAALRAGIAQYLPGVHDIAWVNVVADPVGGLNMDRVIGSQGNSVASWNNWLAANLAANERILDWNAYCKNHPTLSDPANGASNWQNDAAEVHMNASGYTLRNVFLQNEMDLTPADILQQVDLWENGAWFRYDVFGLSSGGVVERREIV